MNALPRPWPGWRRKRISEMRAARALLPLLPLVSVLPVLALLLASGPARAADPRLARLYELMGVCAMGARMCVVHEDLSL